MVNMAKEKKIQDCFKLEKSIKERAERVAKQVGMAKSTLYRVAVIKYIESIEKV